MAHATNELASLGELIFFIAITLLALSWMTVGLRIWVRCGITKSPGWDDASIVFTLCLFTCYVAFILVLVISGREMEHFSLDQIKQSLILVQLSEVFYILTTTFLKISLGLFFLRLLTQPWQRYLFHTILVVSAVYGTFYFLFTVLVCGSPARLADSFTGSSNCASIEFKLASGYIYGIINVLADWTFTLVPILILVKSDMDRRSKISISIVIGFAAIGSVSSILRMVYLKGLLFKTGVTATSIKATIWATAEPGTGIIASSAAILRPLFRKLASDVRTKVTNNGESKIKSQTATADNASIIALKSTDTTAKERRSSVSDGAWEERTSFELAHVGVGRPITITVAAGPGVAPLAPRRI